MGYYLKHQKNEDPAPGRHPNENYAREVLQLFSIGLAKLKSTAPSSRRRGQGDAHLRRGDRRTSPRPSRAGASPAPTRQLQTFQTPRRTGASRCRHPVAALDRGEEAAGRRGAAAVPAAEDLKDALDNIFYHPNVGPFISRQLIQRLVTSNPSPATSRVATVFANNGPGVRGDLAAVVKTILLDPEARDADLAASVTFGKQKEPMIRFVEVPARVRGALDRGRNYLHYSQPRGRARPEPAALAERLQLLLAQLPTSRPAGGLGLVAPEFQITTEPCVIATPTRSPTSDGSGDTSAEARPRAADRAGESAHARRLT